MDEQLLQGRLAFLKAAEALKDTLRSGHTSQGRPESTAEQSWRLCLLALAFEEQLPGLDMLRLLKLCIVHDLGEAIGGHNQGSNPPGFDYGFNLGYGQHYTAAHPVTAAIRAMLDRETRAKMDSTQ